MIKDIIGNKIILITGGTGSLGQALTKDLLKYNPKKIVLYSRNEKNQYDMEKSFQGLHDDKLRFILGDIRDKEALTSAMTGCQIVFHTAALKQVPLADYNPDEFIKTIINGSQNIIHAAIQNNVERVVALSTDKASSPSTFYGMAKGLADKLFQSANVYSKSHSIKLMVVRYGNVASSNGSVIPYFKKLVNEGKNILPITHPDMTRFWISLDEAIQLIYTALEKGKGGEIFVSKLPSFKILDLVKAFNCDYKVIGIRGSEKLHEELISEYDNCVYEFNDHYIIYPSYGWYDIKRIDMTGRKCPELFYLRSNNNNFLSVDEIKERIKYDGFYISNNAFWLYFKYSGNYNIK